MKTKILFTDFQPQPSTSRSKKKRKKDTRNCVRSNSSDEISEKKPCKSDTVNENNDDEEGEKITTTKKNCSFLGFSLWILYSFFCILFKLSFYVLCVALQLNGIES